MKKHSLVRCNPNMQHNNLSENYAEMTENIEEVIDIDKIQIVYGSKNNDNTYKGKVIYDSYKPRTLRAIKDYFTFIISQRQILPNSIFNPVTSIKHPLDNPEVAQEIRMYYESELESKFLENVDQEKILIFDSNFECGNLDRACIISLNEYNLYLNTDTNTKGHCQWYYFSVTNTEEGTSVKFNIINFRKWLPLYKIGMKPLVFSEIDFEKTGVGWIADTYDVMYTKSGVGESVYRLKFSYTFKNTGDRVYFATTRPYSYTMLKRLLDGIKENLIVKAKKLSSIDNNKLQKKIRDFIAIDKYKEVKGKAQDEVKNNLISQYPEMMLLDNFKTLPTDNQQSKCLQSQDYRIETNSFIYTKETLCLTLSGLPIEIITITPSNTSRLDKRKVIFITARTHAAEVAGSFKIEGILHFLTGDSTEAKGLREVYIFKIVPMLNPEGVLCGNYRCTLTGTDLNRRWDCPNEYLHPQIYYLKYLLKMIAVDGKEILAFCDLHEHGRKLNSFIYGCNKVANGSFCSWTKVRLLPRILAKNSPLFSYGDCRFSVESDKKRTARVVIWKELEVINSFTLESSCYGYFRGTEITPFGNQGYFEIGEALLKSLLEYHYVIKEIEQELIITRGWLKPSKLIEITGTPAAVLLAKKLAEEKQEIERKIRMSKVKKLIEERRDKASNFY